MVSYRVSPSSGQFMLLQFVLLVCVPVLKLAV